MSGYLYECLDYGAVTKLSPIYYIGCPVGADHTIKVYRECPPPDVPVFFSCVPIQRLPAGKTPLTYTQWLFSQTFPVFASIMRFYSEDTNERYFIDNITSGRLPSFRMNEILSGRLPLLDMQTMTALVLMSTMSGYQKQEEIALRDNIISGSLLFHIERSVRVAEIELTAFKSILPEGYSYSFFAVAIGSARLFAAIPKSELQHGLALLQAPDMHRVSVPLIVQLFSEYQESTDVKYLPIINLLLSSRQVLLDYNPPVAFAVLNSLVSLMKYAIASAYDIKTDDSDELTEDHLRYLRKRLLPLKDFFINLLNYTPICTKHVLFRNLDDGKTLFSSLLSLLTVQPELLGKCEFRVLLADFFESIDQKWLFSETGFSSEVRSSPAYRFQRSYAKLLGEAVNIEGCLHDFLTKIAHFRVPLQVKKSSRYPKYERLYLSDKKDRMRIEQLLGLKEGGLLTFEQIKSLLAKQPGLGDLLAHIPGSNGFYVTKIPALVGAAEYGLVSDFPLKKGAILPYMGAIRYHKDVEASNHFCVAVSKAKIADPTYQNCSVMLTANHSGLGSFELMNRAPVVVTLAGQEHAIHFVHAKTDLPQRSAILWDYGDEFRASIERDVGAVVGLSIHDYGITTQMIAESARFQHMRGYYYQVSLPDNMKKIFAIQDDEKVWGNAVHHLLLSEPPPSISPMLLVHRYKIAKMPLLCGKDAVNLSTCRIDMLALIAYLGHDALCFDLLWRPAEYLTVHQRTLDSLLHYAIKSEVSVEKKLRMMGFLLEKGVKIDYKNQVHHSALFVAIDHCDERSFDILDFCLASLKAEKIKPTSLKTIKYPLREDQSDSLTIILKSRMCELGKDEEDEVYFQKQNGYPELTPHMYAALKGKLEVLAHLRGSSNYASSGYYQPRSEVVRAERLISEDYMSLALLMILLRDMPEFENRLNAFYMSTPGHLKSGLLKDMLSIGVLLGVTHVFGRIASANDGNPGKRRRFRASTTPFALTPAKSVFDMPHDIDTRHEA